ncbi:hypothetical protein NMY22_g8323 [Coprinellus aureogranulatus]|nr:hypothetical protein NMY22_g8323 [Coprinellus aureogranulatus]
MPQGARTAGSSATHRRRKVSCPGQSRRTKDNTVDRQLVHHLGSLVASNHESTEEMDAGARYLVQHFDIGILEDALNCLNPTLIPQRESNAASGSSPAHTIASAAAALRDLLTITECLKSNVAGLLPVKQSAIDSRVTNSLFWMQMGGCINVGVAVTVLGAIHGGADPVRIIRQTVEGGMLRNIAQCMAHMGNSPPASYAATGTYESLRYILQFMPIREVYAIASEDEDAILSSVAEAEYEWIHERLRGSFRRTRAALKHEMNFGKANACSNLKVGSVDPIPCTIVRAYLRFCQHVDLDVRSEMRDGHMRTCGNCHSVYYCSRACQEEDWYAYHSSECASNTESGSHPLPSFRRRIDQLTHIEALANALLPPLPELNLREIKQGTSDPSSPDPRLEFQRYRPDSSLAYYDCSDLAENQFYDFSGRLSLIYRDRTCWTYINGASEPRVQACVRDMENDPDSILLMEGVCAFNLQKIAFVLTKMKYNAMAGPAEAKYKVVGHVYRVAK